MATRGGTRRELLAGALVAGALTPFAAARAGLDRAASRLDGLDGLADAYDLDPSVTYLNHASIGTVPRAVREAREAYLLTCERNPWLHVWGGAWDEAVAAARGRAARFVGCAPDELAVTHNTTEAFGTLAHGLPLGPEDEVLFSSLNHVGASRTWEHAAEVRGYRVRRFSFPIGDARTLSEDDLVALHLAEVRDETSVLVLPHVDNTVGIRHPVARIARAARERGVRFVAVDGAQTVGMFPVELPALGVDFFATSAHKWLQAPKEMGLFYVRREAQEHLRPLWVTWGQDRWRESARKYADYGTRDLSAVLALDDAVRFQQAIDPAARLAHLRALRQRARGRVGEARELSWRSPEDWELGGSLFAVEVEGRTSSEVFDELFREHGFVFRPFSVDGLNTIRISPNAQNTTAELDALFDRLASLLR